MFELLLQSLGNDEAEYKPRPVRKFDPAKSEVIDGFLFSECTPLSQDSLKSDDASSVYSGSTETGEHTCTCT